MLSFPTMHHKSLPSLGNTNWYQGCFFSTHNMIRCMVGGSEDDFLIFHHTQCLRLVSILPTCCDQFPHSCKTSYGLNNQKLGLIIPISQNHHEVCGCGGGIFKDQNWESNKKKFPGWSQSDQLIPQYLISNIYFWLHRKSSVLTILSCTSSELKKIRGEQDL